MKAIVHEGHPGVEQMMLKNMPETDPEPTEVKVKLKSAGLNHRDLFVLQRREPDAPPLILGSDGAGVVAAVGEKVQHVQVGEEVIINPGLGWVEKSDAPPQSFEILGLPDHGTFAESITISADQVEPKPRHMSWSEAGVLGLAALTGYRALFTKAQVQAEHSVLIPGIGSGVATFLLQMAKAVGAKVIVTSRSMHKREQALCLGADRVLDSNEDWAEQLNGEKVDIVIESIGAATFNQSLDQLRPGGTMVTFGASAGDRVTFDLRSFFYGQYRLLGTTMGSREEFRDMLRFIDTHQIRPVMDQVFALHEAKQAFQRMEDARQFGKIGFAING
jgi:zinc-binding alcohol dehydrogenase/oxidoreductase